MRIWIKRDAAGQVVLNNLYKLTDLQTSFGINMIAIVNRRPQLLTLRDALMTFIDHRRQVVTRRSRFELRKAMERREIVEGLGVAVDAIDRVIAIIRGSADPDTAKDALMAEAARRLAAPGAAAAGPRPRSRPRAAGHTTSANGRPARSSTCACSG
ncbi:MAG: DNA gyrase subunit A [Nannocystaceae bacterium]